MRNKTYTYINTTDKPQMIAVEAIIDGVRKTEHFPLYPKQVEGDILQRIKFLTGVINKKKIKIVSVTATEHEMTASGETKVNIKTIGPKVSLSREEIIKKSIILDIETTGLRGGDLIHQVATYEPGAKKAHLWAPRSEMLVHDKAGGEEALSGRLHLPLVGKRYDVSTPKEGKLAETLNN